MLAGLVGIFIAIVAIILLTWKGWKLEWAMFTGALIVGFFSGLSPVEGIIILGNSLRDPVTVYLLLVIIAITSFGNLLLKTGYLEGMIENLGKIIKDFRLLLGIIPALVGLLMVPGGAVFSAPMIEGMGKEVKMNKDIVASVNVVFRHLFYLIFPLYPPLLLIAEVSNIGIYSLIVFNLPVLILGLAVNSFYFFAKHSSSTRRSATKKMNARLGRELFISLFPFIMVLVLGIIFDVYFPLALLAGILFVVVAGYPGREEKYSFRERAAQIIPGINWSMALAIVGIMVFKDFVEASGALDDLSVMLLGFGMPLLLLAILFPFVTGIITANHSAAIGITISIFLHLLPQGNAGVAYMGIIFISSLAGYVASPFHLCLIFTVEHFKANLLPVLIKVSIACSFLVALGLVQFIIYTLS